MTAPHPERHRRLLYGRRKGPKLRAHQAALLETLLPKLTLKIEQGADPKTYFAEPVSDVWLEVGFGAGEHLAALAHAHPSTGFIGAEPFVNGVAKLLSKIEASTPTRIASQRDLPLAGGGKEDTTRIPPPERGRPGGGHPSDLRIHMGDARDVIAALPDRSLGCVIILFPDPWPKARHHKRRFIQMQMLDDLARAMKPGAELRFATDDPGYLAWALERLCAHPAFFWTARCADDWRNRPADWPQTRYEQKAIRGVPGYFTFVRV